MSEDKELKPKDQTQAKLVNPPTSQTEMVAKSTEKKVKIRALMPIRLGKDADARVLEVGDVAEVKEKVAKEFCDRKFRGYPQWFGKRQSDQSTVAPMRVRAERVAESVAVTPERATNPENNLWD